MTRRRIEGIPNFRQDQKKAMATRRGHGEQGGHMAPSAATKPGNKIMPNDDVVSPDGELLFKGNPEPEPTEAEAEARELANRDSESDPDMLELLEHQAVAWMPQEGDRLTGTVVGRYTRTDGDYGDYDVIEVATASGAVIAWHAFGTVAKNAVARRNPQDGDRIGVMRLGMVESKVRGHQPYANYNVVVKRGQRPVPDGVMTPTGNSGGDWNRA
jgi:pyruvate/2-oxoacid:ferredoxin oxidoreductase alpha subunit